MARTKLTTEEPTRVQVAAYRASVAHQHLARVDRQVELAVSQMRLAVEQNQGAGLPP